MATTSFSGHRVLLRAPGYPIVGINFFGTAFSEPTLIRLASGFEAATQAASPHLSRVPRPDRRPWKPAPTLSDFCKRVETFASAHYQHAPKTLLWYKFGLKTIRQAEIVSRKLDEITAEHIAGFVASLQSRKWEVASINSALRAVR